MGQRGLIPAAWLGPETRIGVIGDAMERAEEGGVCQGRGVDSVGE